MKHKRIMVFICNECGHMEEQPDHQDYDDIPEIVYEDDVGCSLCRQKDKGYTPFITFREEELDGREEQTVPTVPRDRP